MDKLIKNNYEIIIAFLIFAIIIVSQIEFYKAVILLLELIVILEVVKMIVDFIHKNKLSLRYIIDVFIIFLIRDIVILVTNKSYDKEKIFFLLIVVAIFFLFRIITIIYSPILYKRERKIEKNNFKNVIKK